MRRPARLGLLAAALLAAAGCQKPAPPSPPPAGERPKVMDGTPDGPPLKRPIPPPS